MSSGLLIIFMIGSSITLRDFLSRFLKYCFYKYIPSSWVAAFNLALAMLFLLLTSFTVCHVILDHLSSNKSLILLIWSWIYSVSSFRYALLSSLWAVLSFWALALVGFLLLHWDVLFTLSHFFLTANFSLCFAFSLVGIHSAVAKYAHIYILSSTDRLFHCITTHWCG